MGRDKIRTSTFVLAPLQHPGTGSESQQRSSPQVPGPALLPGRTVAPPLPPTTLLCCLRTEAVSLTRGVERRDPFSLLPLLNMMLSSAP